MGYERKEPLPKAEDRFEDFYIRYDVRMNELSSDMAVALDAEVWETCEWTADGKPVFFNAGPTAPGLDPAKIEPLFTVSIGWDGCSHLRMPYLHFDELEEFEAVGRVVKYLYEDVCDRHDVGD